jgi:hypothetical protein
VWSGVLAFDRVGSRIPQLIQKWLGEFFLVMPLAFFIGKVIDIRGWGDCPGTGESLDGTFWGALAVAGAGGFFFVRGLVRPQLAKGQWSPSVKLDLGDVGLQATNPMWSVEYVYLTSHPSYALLLLLTLPIPLMMVWASKDGGCSLLYYRAAGWAGIGVIAAMALARVAAWYVLRLGRAGLPPPPAGVSAARAEWEIAWKPVLVLVVMMYAIPGIPLAWMFWQEARTVAALPVASAADAGRVGEYRRVEGRLLGEPVYWAPNGAGRGGNNFAGAGALVALDGGGEALLLAESMSVADFRGVLDDARRRDGRVRSVGRVIDRITPDQAKYYGLTTSAFPPPPPAGRVMLVLSYP